MESYPYHDWSRLVGTPVQIRKNGQLVRAGVVDAAMPDSSVLWLAADSLEGRALYSADDGYEAWLRPVQACGRPGFVMAALR